GLECDRGAQDRGGVRAQAALVGWIERSGPGGRTDRSRGHLWVPGRRSSDARRHTIIGSRCSHAGVSRRARSDAWDRPGLRAKEARADRMPPMQTFQPRHFAIVPAAGSGSRMGAARPKQYLPLLGRPLIHHALAVLCAAPEIDQVFVVLSVDGAEWSRHDWSM